jgi:hypothetical protein
MFGMETEVYLTKVKEKATMAVPARQKAGLGTALRITRYTGKIQREPKMAGMNLVSQRRDVPDAEEIMCMTIGYPLG